MSERELELRRQLDLDSAYETCAMGDYDIDRYCDARNAYRDALLAARDAEWRAAVERLKADHLTVHRNPLSILDDILSAIEGK